MIHTPVLFNEIVELYKQHSGPKRYLDLTAGYGGHASAIIADDIDYILVDRDKNSINHLAKKGFKKEKLIHARFDNAVEKLKAAGQKFDFILADFGLSSPQIDQSERGFSLHSDSALDMRMDQNQELDALHVINQYGEEELVHILKEFGEEPKAKQIARAIVSSRPINSTKELADLVQKFWRNSRTHPATRTFQAIRIEVNDELVSIQKMLQNIDTLMHPNSIFAVISFHSLEDRIVKRYFAENSGNYDSLYKLLTPKPIIPTEKELKSNSRSRSAKLRAVQKI